MISGEQWGGQDVGGLMGFTVPNTGAAVRGYAFCDEHVHHRHAHGAARSL